MIQPFTFTGTPEIHFGTGSYDRLPGIIRRFGNHVLLVTGENSFVQGPYWDQLKKQLKQEGTISWLTHVDSEPTSGFIDGETGRFRPKKVNVVVAVGGGSVMDAGKAISAMLTKNEPVVSYLEGVGHKTHDGKKIPFIAVPTTAGTGSEVTKNAVICQRGEKGYKKSLRHQNLIPDVAIVDPRLTISCPAEITAISGLDAFSQLLESYTSTKASAMTDSLALDALSCAVRSLLTACQDGTNTRARTDLSYAAMISGITLANAGLGLIHGLAGTIGGMYDIPHGALCGGLLSAINRRMIEKIIEKDDAHRVLGKFAAVGMMFHPHEQKSLQDYALSLADRLQELVDELKVPRFSDLHGGPFDLDRIIEQSGHKNNPVELSTKEIREALEERL